MGKMTAWMLLMAAGCGAAWAKKPVDLDRWEAVERLRQGAEINVTSGRRVAPDLCLVSTVDENALTCVDENSNVRMIFPRNAVQNVWVFEKAPNRHVGLWIAVVISAGLEIASCVFEGPGGCAFTGFMLFLAWVSAADAPPYPIWLPNSPRPERWRRRLVYQMPVSAVAP
jgi:hypothetical protein